MGLAAGDELWKHGASFKKSPVAYSIVPEGLHVIALSKTVTIKMTGLSDAERDAVKEMAGILASMPREVAAGTASSYDLGLHNYAKRLMGKVWPFLLASKWSLAKKTLEGYVGRSHAGFPHDVAGRSQYQDHLERGMSCCAHQLTIHADPFCSDSCSCDVRGG